MNTKVKYGLSLFVMLLIGFILGFLITGRIVQRKINRLQKYYTEQGFRSEFMRTLKPTPEQLHEIRPILIRYGQRNHVNMMMFRKRQLQLLLHLQKDLKPFLKPSQNNRIEKLEKRWRKRLRQQQFNRINNRTRMRPGTPIKQKRPHY